MIRRRVGVLELLAAHRSQSALEKALGALFLRQTASIGPQAVSAWCRRAGHEVYYSVWDGTGEPHRRLPPDLDIVFIACHSPASHLAYALARLFRNRGAVTVIGGPHATSFPDDCLRFFDTAVGRCDEALVRRILEDPGGSRGALDCGFMAAEYPSVQERMPEIRRSAFLRGRPHPATVIPLLASAGCPYTCDFCIDWDRDYLPRADDALESDLSWIAENWPGVKIGFHDPNFGVRFDPVIEALERRTSSRTNRYLMQCSLAVLNRARMRRLRETGCFYIAPSIESWTGYSDKSGVPGARGEDKMAVMLEQIRELSSFVPGIQVNFVFGLDGDAGMEGLELTRQFIRELPGVLTTATAAMPYGGTPLYRKWSAENRILTRLPFPFWYLPHIAMVPPGESPLELYDKLILMFEAMTSRRTLARRRASNIPRRLRWIHNRRAAAARRTLASLRDIRRRLEDDERFRAFHQGRDVELPAYYCDRLDSLLGPYSELLTGSDLVPRHDRPHPGRD